MKLLLSAAVYGLFFVALGGGLILLVQGKPALLVGGALVYSLMLARIGCAAH